MFFAGTVISLNKSSCFLTQDLSEKGPIIEPCSLDVRESQTQTMLSFRTRRKIKGVVRK